MEVHKNRIDIQVRRRVTTIITLKRAKEKHGLEKCAWRKHSEWVVEREWSFVRRAKTQTWLQVAELVEWKQGLS